MITIDVPEHKVFKLISYRLSDKDRRRRAY